MTPQSPSTGQQARLPLRRTYEDFTDPCLRAAAAEAVHDGARLGFSDSIRWMGYADRELQRLRDQLALRVTGYADGMAQYAADTASPDPLDFLRSDEAVEAVARALYEADYSPREGEVFPSSPPEGPEPRHYRRARAALVVLLEALAQQPEDGKP